MGATQEAKGEKQACCKRTKASRGQCRAEPDKGSEAQGKKEDERWFGLQKAGTIITDCPRIKSLSRSGRCVFRWLLG